MDRSPKLLFKAKMQLVAIHPCFGAKRLNSQGCGGIHFDLLAYLRELAALSGGDAYGRTSLRSSALPVLKQQSQQVKRYTSHGKIVPGARQADIKEAAGLGQRGFGRREVAPDRLPSCPIGRQHCWPFFIREFQRVAKVVLRQTERTIAIDVATFKARSKRLPGRPDNESAARALIGHAAFPRDITRLT